MSSILFICFLLAHIIIRSKISVLAGFHALVLGHIWYQGKLEAITICGSLRNLVRDTRLSLLRWIAVLGLSLLLGMLDVSVHLEINQLLVGIYQLVSGVGVDH